MGRLKGKVAVVTGGSRGIGAAIARRYGAEGARVAVVYKAAAEAADQVVADIEAAGSEATAVRCNVAQTAACNAMAEVVAAAFGGTDILVNNAGIYLLTTLGETSEDEWDSQMNTNVKGAYFVAQALLPQMMARGGGKIINIGSILGETGLPSLGDLQRHQGRHQAHDPLARAGSPPAQHPGQQPLAGHRRVRHEHRVPSRVRAPRCVAAGPLRRRRSVDDA